MYWNYVMHGVKPSEWYAMGPGERVVLRAFMLKEIEGEEHAREEIENKVKGG